MWNDRWGRYESRNKAALGLSVVFSGQRPTLIISATVLGATLFGVKSRFSPLPKGTPLERSLTVLLPVHNAQSTLAATVQELLDVISDLTERFELVIVDDGSTDATSEVAHDLTQHYPQIHAVRHGKCLGHEAAIHEGLKRSSGEIIFVPDETGRTPVEGIPGLWYAAHQPAAGHSLAARGPKWTRFSARHSIGQTGYRIIDRRTIDRRRGPSQPSRPNYLARLKSFALGE